jgi:hypothetical protein
MHGPEPAHAQQLGDAAGVLAVGLHHHRRERRLDVPGLEQHRVKPGCFQPGVQPLRQWPRLQADPLEFQAEPAQKVHERLGLARHLGLTHHRARRIDHAYAAQFQ